MEHDETSKLADVQTKPADLLVNDLADEPAAVVKTTESTSVVKTTEPAAEPAEPRTKAAKTKNPKRVEQGKKFAEWNKANKRRQLLEPTLKQVEATRPALQQLEATSSTPEPALKQLEDATSGTKPKSNTKTKDYFSIGETILIIGLLSVGLFCYTTSLTSTDKTQFEASKKAQLKSTQLEAQSSKKSSACRNSVERRQYF